MDYNNTADEGSVGVIVANGETEFVQDTIAATLPIGEYFHWAVSLDYEKGFATFAFSGKDLNSTKTLTVNFPEFKLREKLEIDVGCIPTDFENDEGKEVVLSTCSKGKAKNTTYFLESFADLSTAKYLSPND